MASKNPIYALMWLVLLVFLAWPLAGFLTMIWVVLQPFEPLFGFIKDINSAIEKYITWPRECGKAIWNCSNRCPQP